MKTGEIVTVNPSGVEAGLGLAADAGRVLAVKPTQSDVRAAFKDKVVDHPDGTYTVDLTSKADLAKLRELKAPYSRAAAEVGRAMHGREPTIDAVRPDGRRVTLRADQERVISRRGFRSPGVTGRRKRVPIPDGELPRKPLRTVAEVFRTGE